MKMQSYDLIGDIHGQYHKLTRLLDALGYHNERKDIHATWQHPQGRKVIFLGDYIDRGPAIRETLHTVRAMVEAEDALAIMGNHEFNMICAETPDGKGGHLRQGESKRAGQLETRRQFVGHEKEWEAWLCWMRRLPLSLDLGALRAVHACWDASSIALLQGHSFDEPDFLLRCATRQSREYHAVETVLKGPELALPEGQHYRDKEGTLRHQVRVRWWNLPQSARVSQLAMPEPFDVPGEAAPEDLRRIPHYAADDPPVFFGHYWLPPNQKREPLAANVACLDYSAAFDDNQLTAYRWDGEKTLLAEKFFMA